jgi:DNA-binding NarL/FixJ family response regulator
MKILIADDHGIVRQGLRSLIEKHQEMQIVAEAEDGLTTVALAQEFHPDVVIMDVTMPKLNGIEATRQIVSKVPQTKVIALSMHAEGHIIKGVLDAGASGYVLKSYLFDELHRALTAVSSGGYYLSPRITDLLVHDWLGQTDKLAAQPAPELTSRERRILQLTAEGKSVKEIALVLHISHKTAHANRHALMEKLELSTVAELTKYAISEGLTSVEF